MKTYNIIFGDAEKNTVSKIPNNNSSIIEGASIPDRPVDGWAGRCGPGIPWENWPRDSEIHSPMFHVLTIRVPQEYRQKSDEFVALSFFQGYADQDKPNPLIHLLSYEMIPHPQFTELTDIIDGKFGFIWLTEEEFSAGPLYPGEGYDVSLERNHSNDGITDWEDGDSISNYIPVNDGPNAWEDEDGISNYVPAWVVERDDPQGGKRPNEYDEDGYISGMTDDSDWYDELYDKLYSYSHFGGTCFPTQSTPELTPFYLELEEYPGMNLGGDGNLQLDLKTNVFDWACG